MTINAMIIRKRKRTVTWLLPGGGLTMTKMATTTTAEALFLDNHHDYDIYESVHYIYIPLYYYKYTYILL